MKVIFLPNNTASLMSTMIPQLRKKGVDAIGFNFAPKVFQTKQNIHNFPDTFLGKLLFAFKFLYHLITADVVHWVYGSGSWSSRPLLFLVSVLKRKKFVEYCGTDVRSLEKLCSDVPSYDFEKFSSYQKIQLGTAASSLKTQKLFKTLGFIPMPNSPELIDYLIPEVNRAYISVSRSIDLSAFTPGLINAKRKLPLVVHIPTNAEIKGTNSFLRAAEELEKEGKLQYKMIQNISREEALKVLSEADIVVDQLLIGEYGVLSMEAMALGKPVVCFIRPKLMSYYQTLEPVLPIVNADSDTIKIVLSELCKDEDLRRALGNKGRDYVHSFHNAEKNADHLINIYLGKVDFNFL